MFRGKRWVVDGRREHYIKRRVIFLFFFVIYTTLHIHMYRKRSMFKSRWNDEVITCRGVTCCRDQKTLAMAVKGGTRFGGNIPGAGRGIPNGNDAAKFSERRV